MYRARYRRWLVSSRLGAALRAPRVRQTVQNGTPSPGTGKLGSFGVRLEGRRSGRVERLENNVEEHSGIARCIFHPCVARKARRRRIELFFDRKYLVARSLLPERRDRELES